MISPFRLPAFWRGAIETRRQVMRQATDDYERSAHAAAIRRLEAILAAVEGGMPLAACEDFGRWLTYSPSNNILARA